jgi:hypothetical protein
MTLDMSKKSLKASKKYKKQSQREYRKKNIHKRNTRHRAGILLAPFRSCIFVLSGFKDNIDSPPKKNGRPAERAGLDSA